MADPVTPKPGQNWFVSNGGTSVIAIGPLPNGGIITNPYSAEDQGIDNVEPIYVDPVQPAGLAGNNTSFSLQPGQSWEVISGQTTPTYVNAQTPGHKFSVVSW